MQLYYCRQHIWQFFNLKLEAAMYTHMEVPGVGSTNDITSLVRDFGWITIGSAILFWIRIIFRNAATAATGTTTQTKGDRGEETAFHINVQINLYHTYWGYVIVGQNITNRFWYTNLDGITSICLEYSWIQSIGSRARCNVEASLLCAWSTYI